METVETVKEMLARPLPALISPRGTSNPSDSRTIINVRLFHEWSRFGAEVRRILEELGLDQTILQIDDSKDKHYIVGNELGLTGRFCRHACDAVSRALATTDLSIRFGDRQAANLPVSDIPPDVVLLKGDNPRYLRPVMVIELKTFWTVNLDVDLDSPQWERIAPLQSHLGQVVCQMRDNNTRYGVLSTYEYTYFIRRENDSGAYEEDPKFEVRMHGTGAQASDRPSHLRRHSAYRPTGQGSVVDIPTFAVTSQTILFGDMEQVATNYVDVVKCIQTGDRKSIFEVIWDGQPAVAKCWVESEAQSYTNERVIYETLSEKSPRGYSFFADFYTAGLICCSSVFSTGNILVIQKVKGVPLHEKWNYLSEEKKEFVYHQVSQAIQALRGTGVLWADPGMHNVLYDDSDGHPTVTVVDFERIQLHEDEPLLYPTEMARIFGREAVKRRAMPRYPGG
ncbi:hypothetical protein N7532_000004 [Penicillium argentinense]|uniref:Protein kinase domain-containing protein n=1 Tax=Penicillium argentinense TaxID=1131581 RepID=A0A9W9KM79_9EURO|nr:uncharacterized protein N7532_000004 [Penicillium argentinense]KAJ5111959.1 hypothetical protein N7532_000004 [Penicillium argentinense]